MGILIILVLFIIFASSDFWLTTSGILFAIAIISGIISAVTKESDDNENSEGTNSVISLLSVLGAVASLIIGLLKLVF